jgi:hypothetical protein
MQVGPSSSSPTPRSARPRHWLKNGAETVGGTLGAALEVSNSLVPSLITGVGSALRQGQGMSPESRLERTKSVLNQAMWGQMAVLAVGYLASHLGPASVATTVFGKGILGVALAGLYTHSGATQRLAEGVQKSVESIVDGSESKPRKVVEGLGAGLKAGLVDSAKVGFRAGQGAVGGILDSLSQLRLKPRLSVSWLHPVRLVGGVAGVAANTAVSAAQGFWQGLGVPATAIQHTRLSLTQGAVVGGLLGVSGGWVGLALGAALGGTAGWGVSRLASQLGLDQRWSRVTEATVELSQRNLAHHGEQVSDSYRNAAHGLITGAGTGIRAGWKYGAEAAERALIDTDRGGNPQG